MSRTHEAGFIPGLFFHGVPMLLRAYLYAWLIDPLIRGMRRKMAAWIRESEPETVLDVCCGTGALCRDLEKQGTAVTGLDLDKALMIFAGSRAGSARFAAADAGAMPWPDGTFGAVTLSYSLHDKSPALRQSILNEIRRVLKPGGRLFVTDFEKPAGFSWYAGDLWIRIPEISAGLRHYRNGREFIRSGGLSGRMAQDGWAILRRRTYPWGNSALLECRSGQGGPGSVTG